jgi:hypothetical protein
VYFTNKYILERINNPRNNTLLAYFDPSKVDAFEFGRRKEEFWQEKRE